MAPPQSTERLLTAAEAAAFIGVEESTLTTWRYRRQGPPFLKLGHRTVRYLRGDIDAWVKRNRRLPA